MNPPAADEHLSHIATLWALVQRAHQGTVGEAGAARQAPLERYAGAVYRYLMALLRDREAADDLFQEFSLRFLRGDFRNADPAKGKFRVFLKSSVYYLAVGHRKKRQRERSLELDARTEPADGSCGPAGSEQEFLESWRQGLMDRAWQALAELEQQTGQPHHSVLRLRSDQPERSNGELAGQLHERLGKPMTVAAFSQALHRAREKFADLLLSEVIHSLEGPAAEELEQELIELGWLTYLRAALKRRGLGT